MPVLWRNISSLSGKCRPSSDRFLTRPLGEIPAYPDGAQDCGGGTEGCRSAVTAADGACALSVPPRPWPRCANPLRRSPPRAGPRRYEANPLAPPPMKHTLRPRPRVMAALNAAGSEGCGVKPPIPLAPPPMEFALASVPARP